MGRETEQLKRKLAGLLMEYHLAKKQVGQEILEIEEAKLHTLRIEEAQRHVQEVAQAVQRAAHKQIAGIVTRCLKAVFGEEEGYEFQIQFEQKRGKTEARLTFVRGGREISPLHGSGGGVVDVASFALRLACLILSRPHRRKLLCLDESFKHLSKQYRPAIRRLIEQLAEELGVQVIHISHAQDLVCGEVIEL